MRRSGMWMRDSGNVSLITRLAEGQALAMSWMGLHRDRGCVHDGRPLDRALLRQDLDHDRIELGAIGNPIRISGKPGIVDQLRMSDQLAESCPVVVERDGNNQKTVTSREASVWRHRGMMRSRSARHLAGREVGHRVIGHPGDRRAKQGDIDTLSLARPFAMVERCQDPTEGGCSSTRSTTEVPVRTGSPSASPVMLISPA